MNILFCVAVDGVSVITYSRRIALLALAVPLSACGTVPLPPEYQAELDARQASDVRVGELMRLLDQPPVRVGGLVSQDGRVHVFAVDASKALQHIELEGQTIVKRERVGTLDEEPRPIAFHGIEWPPGTLRVAAGESQFVREAASAAWSEVKGNRCMRFLTVGGRLFCAFVINGEEVASPKRTDLYGGLIIVVPFAIPIEKQSRKLVIADGVAGQWIVRAVVDADDPLDARGFTVGADREGNVHVLYGVGRGGGMYLLFPAGGGGIWEEPRIQLRYARVGSEALLSPTEGTQQASAGPFALVKGLEVRDPPWRSMVTRGWWGGSFAVSPASGTIEGLYASSELRLGGKYYTHGLLLGVELRNGLWAERVSVVVNEDWPEEGLDYGSRLRMRPLVQFDASGALHALIPHCISHSTLQPCIPALSYVVKRGGAWSRPVMFRTGAFPSPQEYARLMIVGEAGVYVVWAEKEVGLLGRWIESRQAPARRAP
jgi:hypothetical protein